MGTPQGSSISPPRFVLYVAPLHKGTARVSTISFVDDLAFTSCSTSHRRNVQLLQARFRALCHKASKLGLCFSVPTMEPTHWCTPQDHSSPSHTPVHLEDGICYPREEVRWLGCCFIPNPTSTPHFRCRLNIAYAEFAMVKKLPPPGVGLSPVRAHCLAQSLLLAVASYGADPFTPNSAMTQKLEVVRHKVQRWVTIFFRTTPVNIRAVESSLPLFGLLLTRMRRLAPVTLACTPSPICTVAAWLPPDYQSLYPFREHS